MDGVLAGLLAVSDPIKASTPEALAALHAAGIRIVMATGDGETTANSVAARLGIDEVHGEVKPEDKLALVERLQREGRVVAMAGDGINDAPVLKRADVGIAMGALGSDAAIEAADVVLMDDDPLKIAAAVKIARRTLAIVKQNIFFALLVKGLILLLGAAGLASMWAAVFADVGVLILAVLNALRTMRVQA